MTHFLRFNHHTQREGEQDVEEHNNHDGDRDPHHELLVLRHLVLEGGVAAFEVVSLPCILPTWIGSATSLKFVLNIEINL